MRRTRDLFRFGKGFSVHGTGNHPHHGNRITADIENTAARRFIGEKPVIGPERTHVETEAGADDADIAHRAGFHQFQQFRRLRMQAVHIGLAGEDACLFRLVENGAGIIGRECDGFFHQHVLAGPDRLDRPFGMAGMGCGDINRIDIGIGKQRVVPMDNARAGKSFCKAGLVRIAGRDGL
ncbi:hypothetical protein D3C80_953000 [compost metagenome]